MQKAVDCNSSFTSSFTIISTLVAVLLVSAACHGSNKDSVVAAASPETPSSAKWSPKACNIQSDVADVLNEDLDTNVHATENIGGVLHDMVLAEQFNELDCLTDHIRVAKTRMSGGVWKLHVLYSAYELPVLPPQNPTEEDWEKLITALRHWTKENPKSITARVALAEVYMDYAWVARGSGYANTISE
ncbi:MAG TPA: hypothetical protein VE843_01135, partial [Ktedonobacteraceae bacterium]|nr:hypothetical protein [Ktedonobacteraceae bacterium]